MPLYCDPECMCAKSLQLCPTLCDLWTIAHQAPLSVGFSRQEYWGALPCPSLGNLPNPGIKPVSVTSPVLEGRFFTTGLPKWALPGKPMIQDAHSQKHWRIKHKHIHVHSRTTEQRTMKQFCMELYYVFPDSAVGKVSACNAGNQVESRGREDPLEKEMATNSSILAWRIPQRSLVGCSSWGYKKLDTTE